MRRPSNLQLLELLTKAMNEAPAIIHSCIYKEKETELKQQSPHEVFNGPDVVCLVQTSGNTACGWGGMAGQAFTSYYTVILEYPHLNVAAVYQAWKAAYICEMDDAYKAMKDKRRIIPWISIEQERDNSLKLYWRAAK